MGARAEVAGPRRESVRVGTLFLAVARAARFSLGFVAMLVIAQAFGTGREADAFFVARVIPILFIDWAGNILKVGFIPTRAEVAARDGEAAARVVSQQFALYAAVLFGGLTIVCAVGAPLVVRVVGIGVDAETHALGTVMLRVLSPAVLLGGLFLVTETLLNAGSHFSTPARARVVGRAVVIVVLFALAGPLGPQAMPLAFLAGAFAQLLLAGRPALDVWRGAARALRPLHPGMRLVASLLVPALIWMLLDQLKFVVDQMFASRLATGQLSALNYAFQIIQVTVSVSAGAYLTALFPALSDLMAGKGDVSPRATAAGGRILFLGVFASLVFVAAAEPLCRLALERGAFTAGATRDTAGALAFYAPSVVLISINMLLKVLLFLRRRVGPILWLGVAELLFNVALNAALVGIMGIRGLALATSVTTLLVTLGLPAYLARHGLLAPRSLVSAALRLVPGALAAFWIVRLITMLGAGASWLLAAAALGGGVLLGGAAYLVSARLLGAWPSRTREAR